MFNSRIIRRNVSAWIFIPSNNEKLLFKKDIIVLFIGYFVTLNIDENSNVGLLILKKKTTHNANTMSLNAVFIVSTKKTLPFKLEFS